MTARRVMVSILDWNGLEDTLGCLSQLMPDLPPDMHVVVLDNGSVDDPGATLARRFPGVEVLREPVNLGFTGGHNRVIRLALERGFESVLLLNNDCRIGAESIAAMLDMLDGDRRIAAVSPLIYNDDVVRRPQMVGGWIDWAGHRAVQPSLPSQPVPPGLPTQVLGTVLLLRCEALRRIGLLDDRYFAYYEDNDLSARIAAAGEVARYCDRAIALHRHRRIGEVSVLSLFLSSRNAWLFWRRHTPAAHRPGLTRALIAQQLEHVADLQAAGASVALQQAVVDGLWQGLRGRSGPPPARRAAPAPWRWLALRAPWLLSQLVATPLDALRGRARRRGARAKAGSTP